MATVATEVGLALERLPKVDLHRHLEGSLRLATLVEIARREDLDLPRDPEHLRPLVQVQPGEPANSRQFLSRFATLRRFYRSPETIRRFVCEAVRDAADDGIRYLELRFNPIALAWARGFRLSEVVDWVADTAEAEAACLGMRLGLIVSVNRHEPVDLAREALHAALTRRSDGILGLDLAGDESGYDDAPFRPLFREARSQGLKITAHAGEWAGAASVRHALESLGAERVGHGVRILEDPAVVALARERNTVFEVCLSSGLQSGAVARGEPHPLLRMIEQGLQVTLNSDDPELCGVRLTDEFALAIERFGFSVDTLKGLVLVAARSAFLPEAERERMLRSLRAELDSWDA